MNTITIDVTKIPPPVMSAHCRTLLECIGDYFDNPAVQREYEAWYCERYGHKPTEASYIPSKEVNT